MKQRLTRQLVLRSAAGGALGTLAFVAACGAPGTGQSQSSLAARKEGKLRLYAATNNIDEGSRYFNQTVFTRFQKQFPNITIEGTFNVYADVMTKVKVEVAAGTAPDLFTFDQTQSPGLAAQGAIKDLSDLIKRDARAVADLAGSWDYFTEPDGRKFGVPAMVTTSALLYNPALFDRFGVKYPDSTFGWNPRDGGSFLEAARKLTRPDQGIWGYWWTGQGTADTLTWLKQNGGSYLDPTRTKADMLKPSSMEAFQWMYDMIHRHQISPKPQDAPIADFAGASTRHALFLSGKVAMFNFIIGQESSWNQSLLPEARIDIAAFPTGARRAAGAAGGPWHVPTSSTQLDVAWELLKWMASDTETQVGVWTDWKWGLPASRRVWTDARVTQPRNHPLKSVKMFLEPLDKGYAVYPEVNPAFAEWYAAFSTPFNTAIRGELAMPAAIQTAQRDVQAVLGAQLPKK
jgi:ABC-type glycerol-3-phosphate transport system substrate-binding protein